MKSTAITFIIPTVVTIVLFFFATFAIIIKPFEKRIRDDKRDLIRTLTDTAWSILEEYHAEEKAGRLSREEAQSQAVERIRSLRYGNEHKDYFWVTDKHPRMIVHPWRPELNDQDMADYKDPTGKPVFVEFVKAVETNGEAFVEYRWQWKDDPDRIEPKLSFVKAFEPWEWIVGTGVYVTDVETEVVATRRNMMTVAAGITLIAAVLLAYFVRQGMASERNRLAAEKELMASHDKYQSLVEASTEGLIMILAGTCVYANTIFTDMCGYIADELGGDWGAKLLSPEDFERVIQNDADMGMLEMKLKTKDGELLDVLLSTSAMEFQGQRGRIYTFKDVTQDRQLARAAMRERQVAERESLIADLQSAQLFMNQPISLIASGLVTVPISTTVRDTARAMTESGATAAIVQSASQPVGIVTDHDLRVKCVAKGSASDMPVDTVMSSPLVTIRDNAMLFEAALRMHQNDLQHLVVCDPMGTPTGIVGTRELARLHSYSSANLVQDIHSAETVDVIVKANARLPLLVRALIRSGVGAEQLTRTITSVTDAIGKRLVELAIADLGEPPVPFAFVALGSEGRCEQTLATDQDNVIIFDDVDDDRLAEVKTYFDSLGLKVCDWLNAVGYRHCPGEIMAKNPKYCQPLGVWKQYFSNWIIEAGPQELLDVHVFFDFRTIYGSESFEDALQAHVKEQLEISTSFLLYFAENCLLYKPPVTMFGKIAVKSHGDHAKTFDIKDAMRPIVNFARLYAIKHDVKETNTIERLNRLAERGVLSEDSLNELVHVYGTMMRLRFEHQAHEQATGREPGNHIDPTTLTELDRAILKEAFAQVNTYRNKISFDFKGRPA